MTPDLLAQASFTPKKVAIKWPLQFSLKTNVIIYSYAVKLNYGVI
jgi:hypothetical protein